MKTFGFLLVILTALPAMAQEPGQIVMPPTWLIDLMMQVYVLPVVGPFLVEAGKWLGFIATVLTGLSVFLISLDKAISSMEKLAGIGPIVSKISDWINKALPYVKYFSVLNVSKEEIKK